MNKILGKLWPKQDKSKDAENYYQQGMMHYQQGKLEEAIVSFTKAIELNPTHAPAYNDRGLTYATQDKYQQAIEDFTQAIKLDPSHAGTYVTRAISYTEVGRFSEAIVDFTKAIEDTPTYAAIYIHRGIAYFRQGSYVQALADYDKAIELEPNNARAYYYRGTVHSERSLYDRAITDYTQAIKLDQDAVDAYYNRGLVYFRQGSTYQQAFQDFSNCLQIIPDSPRYSTQRKRLTDLLSQPNSDVKYWGVDGLHIVLKNIPFESCKAVVQVPGLAPGIFSYPCQAAVMEIEDHACFVQCSKERISLDYFTPEAIDITFQWDNGSITESFRPMYQMMEPNGPGTLPQCKVGVVEIDFQMAKAT